MTIARKIAALPENTLARVGVVLQESPLLIALQEGQVKKAGVLDNYSPRVGDVVALVRKGSSWMVLGRPVADPGVAHLGLHGETGTFDFNIVAATSGTQIITFARPFIAVPSVYTNIATGAGAASGWASRAIVITTINFTIFVFGASTTTTLPVNWLAVEPAV